MRYNLQGQRYGRLLVIERGIAPERNKKKSCAFWLCRCDCGNQRTVSSEVLRRGASNSCGCLSRDVTIARSTTHGEAIRRRQSVEFLTWQRMKDRCYNPKCKNFHRYGGRGVIVAPEWINDYPAFLAHVGRRPSEDYSLDRIDAEGSYAPGNVRWATVMQQNNNRRNSIQVLCDGKKMTLADACRLTGDNYKAMFYRLRKSVRGLGRFTTRITEVD